jgi:hypothetical protein
MSRIFAPAPDGHARSRHVGVHESPAPHDVLALDDEPLDPVGRREDEAGNRVRRASELEPTRAPDGEVGPLPRLERPEVVPPQDCRAAARSESQCLAGRQRRGPASSARDQERLLHLEQEVAALVRRRAVDAEPDPNARIEVLPHRGDARAEA